MVPTRIMWSAPTEVRATVILVYVSVYLDGRDLLATSHLARTAAQDMVYARVTLPLLRTRVLVSWEDGTLVFSLVASVILDTVDLTARRRSARRVLIRLDSREPARDVTALDVVSVIMPLESANVSRDTMGYPVMTLRLSSKEFFLKVILLCVIIRVSNYE